MGADQLQKLDSWRDWEDLFALANFGVAARPGYRLDAAEAMIVRGHAGPLLDGLTHDLNGAPRHRSVLASRL